MEKLYVTIGVKRRTVHLDCSAQHAYLPCYFGIETGGNGWKQAHVLRKVDEGLNVFEGSKQKEMLLSRDWPQVYDLLASIDVTIIKQQMVATEREVPLDWC